MKPPIELKREISTTTVLKNTSELSYNNAELYNCIKKLADNHVSVSGTMIKVTYNKSLKEHYDSTKCSNGHNNSDNGIMFNDQKLDVSIINKPVKKGIRINNTTMNSSVDNSDCFGISKTDTSNISKDREYPIFHSTPKDDLERRKREYINGLNLLVKLECDNMKNSPADIHRPKNSTHAPTSNAKPLNQPSVNLKVTSKKQSAGEQLLAGNIKFPKGITVVRIKGNSNTSKNSKGENSNMTVKDTKSVKPELKRPIQINDNIVTIKKMKKENSSTQQLKKRSIKPYEVSNKQFNTNSQPFPNKNLTNKTGTKPPTSGGYKKELLLHDPDLPPGWKRFIHLRHKGTPHEKPIVYVQCPQGRKFQFKWKLRQYLERKGLPFCPEQFYFGLYKKTKPCIVPPILEVQIHNKDGSIDFKNEVTKEKTQPKSVNLNYVASKPNSKPSVSTSNLNNMKSKEKAVTKKPVYPLDNPNNEPEIAEVDGRQLLLYDPDLPFGWKRIINSNGATGKLQVHIISPEGRIFRRRYRLNEYLIKHQYSYSLDRFYFGLYPKKDGMNNDSSDSDISKPIEKPEEIELPDVSIIKKESDIKTESGDDDDSSSEKDIENEELYLSEFDMSKFDQYNTPMYIDPELPPGWRRFIKIRSYGKSAGRMEVVIVSPDDRRHRSKGQLEAYLQQKQLKYKAEDFDFSVFGRTRNKRLPSQLLHQQPQPQNQPQQQQPEKFAPEQREIKEVKDFKKKSRQSGLSDRPVPDFDLDEIKNVEYTREGEMINMVNGTMIACDLSSGRSERRLRVPRSEQEKVLRSHLESEGVVGKQNDLSISSSWIQRLAKCRSDFRNLDPEAASTIAERTEQFIKELALLAFQNSENSDDGLRYDDVANVVDKCESLASLKSLIPKKITYREFIKLNRPKQFMSFT